MAVALGEGIYRIMFEENGMPKLGSSATSLGIRKHKDIVPDSAGIVYRPSFQSGAPNGLSCAPTIHDLPRFALPVEWGGRNKKTKIWRIEEADLGLDLIAREDTVLGRPRHISIGPARAMPYDDYAKLIAATESMWKRVTKN
jgi:hypothetical protein